MGTTEQKLITSLRDNGVTGDDFKAYLNISSLAVIGTADAVDLSLVYVKLIYPEAMVLESGNTYVIIEDRRFKHRLGASYTEKKAWAKAADNIMNNMPKKLIFEEFE